MMSVSSVECWGYHGMLGVLGVSWDAGGVMGCWGCHGVSGSIEAEHAPRPTGVHVGGEGWTLQFGNVKCDISSCQICFFLLVLVYFPTGSPLC